MPENDQQEEIARIDARCANLREEMTLLDVQIKQLEFQHKKDIADSDKRRNEWDDWMTKKIGHIAKLVGITYEELDLMEDKLISAGSQLLKPREHSTLS